MHEVSSPPIRYHVSSCSLIPKKSLCICMSSVKMTWNRCIHLGRALNSKFAFNRCIRIEIFANFKDYPKISSFTSWKRFLSSVNLTIFVSTCCNQHNFIFRTKAKNDSYSRLGSTCFFDKMDERLRAKKQSSITGEKTSQIFRCSIEESGYTTTCGNCSTT